MLVFRFQKLLNILLSSFIFLCCWSHNIHYLASSGGQDSNLDFRHGNQLSPVTHFSMICLWCELCLQIEYNLPLGYFDCVVSQLSSTIFCSLQIHAIIYGLVLICIDCNTNCIGCIFHGEFLNFIIFPYNSPSHTMELVFLAVLIHYFSV